MPISMTYGLSGLLQLFCRDRGMELASQVGVQVAWREDRFVISLSSQVTRTQKSTEGKSGVRLHELSWPRGAVAWMLSASCADAAA